MAQAQKYIQERCVDSHLSLEMVADSVGITPAYLSRLFYELSEVNFVNYVNECRVQRAKLLLRQSKIPVQEVGFPGPAWTSGAEAPLPGRRSFSVP